MHLPPRTQLVKPFLAMQVLEEGERLRREGIDVIHLSVGEPDFPTPACVVEAAEAALREGRTHYTHSLGDPDLREAIAEHYQSRYLVSVDPGQIVVTSGSSPALLLALAAIVDRGSEVLVPDPGYPCYPNMALFLDARVRRFPLEAAEGFTYQVDRVRERVGRETAAVMINSPANPTGAVLDREKLRALADLPAWIIADETYHDLEYGEPSPTMLEFTDHCFVVNTFSKRYAMTGWRLGWLVAPKQFVAPIQNMQQNLFICAAAFAQRAGIAALRQAGPEVERMRAEYDRRRQYIVPRLCQLGLEVPVAPQGAYYVLADARRLGRESLALSRRILERARVTVTPGVDFGPGGEGFLRFSYATSLEQIEEALDRIEVAMRRLASRGEDASEDTPKQRSGSRSGGG